MSGDLHSPTNAGPDAPGAVPSSIPPPAESAVPGWNADTPAAEDERPEILAGAAFAGGLAAALLLKWLTRDDD